MPSGDGNVDFGRALKGEERWAGNSGRRVGPTPQVGPIQFLEDGGFLVTPTGARFGRQMRMEGCQLGPHIRFDFDDGTARMEDDHEVHHLRFVGKAGWEHAVVRKGEGFMVGAGCGWWLFALVGVTMGLAWCFFR